MPAQSKHSRRSFLAFSSIVALAWTAGIPRLKAETTAHDVSHPEVVSRTALAALPIPPSERRVRLTEAGREGVFEWRDGDHSATVAADPYQGISVQAKRAPASTGAWLRISNTLTPQMFGAMGQKDDTKTLQSFLDHLGDGVSGEISLSHIISKSLHIVRKSNFSIFGKKSAKITTADGTPTSYGFGIIYIRESRDFSIRNITLDGNRDNRIASEQPSHSLIFQSCHNFECHKVHCNNSVCDGFYIASATPHLKNTHSSGFALIDCHANNCFRQGCSIIEGNNGRFSGGSYSGSNGTAPAAGIDLEANPGAPDHAIERISFSEVRFSGNKGYGLIVAGVARPRNIEIADCVFADNEAGAILWGGAEGTITRPLIEGFSDRAVRGAIDVPFGDGGRTRITAPVFRRVSARSPHRPLVYVHSGSIGHVSISGLTADSCAAVVTLNGPNCELIDSRIRPSRAAYNGAIACTGKNCRIAGNWITAFYGAVVSADGPACVISSNTLSDPIYNDRNGCIRTSAAGAVITGNRVTRSGAAAGSGIVATTPPARLDGNLVTGFSERAYALPPNTPAKRLGVNYVGGKKWSG